MIEYIAHTGISFERDLRKFYIFATTEVVATNQILQIASGDEAAFKNLTINGKFRNRGFTDIHGTLYNNGVIENEGTVRVATKGG